LLLDLLFERLLFSASVFLGRTNEELFAGVALVGNCVPLLGTPKFVGKDEDIIKIDVFCYLT
jgi:hypothetical protein